jgi:hypothetical protein
MPSPEKICIWLNILELTDFGSFSNKRVIFANIDLLRLQM